MKNSVLFTLMIAFLLMLSCKDASSPENSFFNARQIPGCNSTLKKVAGDDGGGFSYVFDENLQIKLDLNANCCPDSERFDYSCQISNDTIYFTVIDTAAHLCKCICNYTVTAEIGGLSNDEYTFICSYYDSIYYNEQVSKNHFR